MYLSIYLSIYLTIYIFIYLSIFICIYLSIYLFIYLSTRMNSFSVSSPSPLMSIFWNISLALTWPNHTYFSFFSSRKLVKSTVCFLKTLPSASCVLYRQIVFIKIRYTEVTVLIKPAVFKLTGTSKKGLQHIDRQSDTIFRMGKKIFFRLNNAS